MAVQGLTRYVCFLRGYSERGYMWTPFPHGPDRAVAVELTVGHCSAISLEFVSTSTSYARLLSIIECASGEEYEPALLSSFSHTQLDLTR